MNYDPNLFRSILSQVESCKNECPLALIDESFSYGSPYTRLDIKEYSFDEVYEHILRLRQNNLIETQDVGKAGTKVIEITIEYLTSRGHNPQNIADFINDL